ncbi:alpha/beta hydrolase [Demequina salsinemoris]|uniref:alpha/beta hydrolase n=1 Tax=Demequina salsinemoris TaxID=577470 RepID=UPI0007810876|nr:alpha/beta hydrolase [Demequina salsinemoris]
MKTTAPAWLVWTERALAAAAIAVVAWVLLTQWGAVRHGHPAYAIMLALTVLGAALVGVASWRGWGGRPGWRRVLRILGAVAGLGWIAVTAWLRPFSATEPALAAMASDDAVTVTETADYILFAPTGEASDIALEFQPGARVDPRAYAAVLRPLAEAGHTVVITKQPFGIGFFALDGYVMAAELDLDAQWVVGGHSLGGTVAALQVGNGGDLPVGLLFLASYPADDMSDFAGDVLSISGSEDGLATPDKIDASRDDLPADSTFTVIDGGSHAQFGAYGLQPGDGTPTISNDDAREQISDAALAFLDSLES